MRVAVHDNPTTMQREAWQDGRLVAALSASLMLTEGFKGHPSIFFGLNVGDWSTGQVVGDRSALPTDTGKA